MLDRLEQDLRFFRTALSLREYRQELIASNIANADTPHFKARDIDFKSALKAALGGEAAVGSPLELKRTHAAHLRGEAGDPYAALAKYRAEYQGAVDGNTVNMDVERAAFAENALQTDALLTFINKRFEGLQRAINGQ
ncbi:MAG: flagellar basal body rod protein FlgB [Rhodocyclaceae bacterium]|nr:flagellar basal body rod protein FlgB [Rhodocyclaceae bacterium]